MAPTQGFAHTVEAFYPLRVQLQPQKSHFSENPWIISLILTHFAQLAPCTWPTSPKGQTFLQAGGIIMLPSVTFGTGEAQEGICQFSSLPIILLTPNLILK